MRVGLLWHCVYPWDVRLAKMVRAISEEKHNVCVICKGRSDLPARQIEDNITIRRVSPPKNLPHPIAKAVTFPLFLNPLWIRETQRAIREEQLDLIIVRDLPLAWLAVRAGKAAGIPVILDMAENYPAALISYQK